MKILYVVTGLGLGGAERVVANLADNVLASGCTVKIAYLKGEVNVRPEDESIELIDLDLNGFLHINKSFKKYNNLLGSFKPDIIHSHMIHANIFVRIARFFGSKKFCYKLICSAHNSNEGGFLRMLAYKFTNFLSDLNTNVSIEATKSLIDLGAFNSKNIITVYNGVDLSKFKFNIERKNTHVKTFLSVGRLEDQKDYFNLLDAIYLIKEKTDNIKFFIAGEGYLRDQLEKKIIDLSLEDVVDLLGRRFDIPDLLSSCNYFVLSSKHEGLPTVVIEAMASGTYVIATDCGGVKEIMLNTGTIVEKEDSVKLANALLDALKLDDDQLLENSILAREIVQKKFSLEGSVDAWLNIYGK